MTAASNLNLNTDFLSAKNGGLYLGFGCRSYNNGGFGCCGGVEAVVFYVSLENGGVGGGIGGGAVDDGGEILVGFR